MNMRAPECPACRMKMDEGYVLDNAESNRLKRVAWIEGQPERGGLHGFRIRGARTVATVTFRCPRCGWLVWFAPPPDA
jgi:hypothetical protein